MSFQISMVIYQVKPKLSMNELQKVLSEKWTDLPLATEISNQDEMISFRMGTHNVAIAIMPAPIPWSDLEGPCATSILWKNAATAIRAHKNHAIVTVFGESSPVELSTLLTQITAALMLSTDGSPGVYWCNAALLVPKGIFVDFAVEILPYGPPLQIWVDCRVGWNENKTTSSGFTTGLTELGLMELEAQNTTDKPSELKERFESIARYLLENGLIIEDGDTIGENEDEKIRVVYSKSDFGVQGTVMRLSYEPIEV